MAVINSTQSPAFFRSIGRWLQIWMDVIAAKVGLTGADGVAGPRHDLGIAESEVRSGTVAGFGRNPVRAAGGFRFRRGDIINQCPPLTVWSGLVLSVGMQAWPD